MCKVSSEKLSKQPRWLILYFVSVQAKYAKEVQLTLSGVECKLSSYPLRRVCRTSLLFKRSRDASDVCRRRS